MRYEGLSLGQEDKVRTFMLTSHCKQARRLPCVLQRYHAACHASRTRPGRHIHGLRVLEGEAREPPSFDSWREVRGVRELVEGGRDEMHILSL